MLLYLRNFHFNTKYLVYQDLKIFKDYEQNASLGLINKLSKVPTYIKAKYKQLDCLVKLKAYDLIW